MQLILRTSESVQTELSAAAFFGLNGVWGFHVLPALFSAPADTSQAADAADTLYRKAPAPANRRPQHPDRYSIQTQGGVQALTIMHAPLFLFWKRCGWVLSNK